MTTPWIDPILSEWGEEDSEWISGYSDLEWEDFSSEWVDEIEEWVDAETTLHESSSLNSAILLLIDISGGADWVDSGEHYWLDTTEHYFSDGLVLRASQEGYGDINYWGDFIISVDPPQWQLATVYGGYCDLGWGSINLAQELFDSESLWPPPKKMPVKFYFTSGWESFKELMFEGTAHLSSWSRNGIEYELHGIEYTTDLLEITTDYDSEEADLPIAFGTVEFMPPVRLADVGGLPTYHKASLDGTAGVDWHAYDDGVDIDTNIQDNGDGTFSLTSSPVGEVTVSGTGENSTLSEVFTWAASRLNLNIDISLAQVSSPAISFWADSQIKLIDFLSNISAYFAHLFYIKDSFLFLVSMGVDNGSATYTEHDIGPVEYKENSPIALIKASWQERESVADGDGQRVDIIDKETSAISSYPYGAELSIEPYSADKTYIKSKLAGILSLVDLSNAIVSIPMATGMLPLPGKSITWSESGADNDGPHVRGVTGTIRARTITYDFSNYMVKITGEGTIIAS